MDEQAEHPAGEGGPVSALARRLARHDGEMAQIAEAAAYFGVAPASLVNRWCDVRYRVGNPAYETMADLLARGVVRESDLREAA
jgi:hypothetical protein